MRFRQATSQDVDDMHYLVEHYANREIVLARTKASLLSMIDVYTVVEDEREDIVGLAGLHILANDLAEIRTLVLSPRVQGHGIGKALVNHMVDQADHIDIRRVMALTYQVSFFQKCGFHIVEKEIFPQKVWTDCIHCPKFTCCDETAVLKILDDKRAE